jgi:hypothetical protein
MARCKTIPARSSYSVLLTAENEENPSMALFPSSKCGKKEPHAFFWKVSEIKCISYL